MQKMLGVSMLSMFENTKEKVTVHIMHNDTLTPDNRDKFCYIAGQYNQQIEFHNVEEIAADSFEKFKEVYPGSDRLEKYTNSVWYEFVAYEVFPHLDKLIFLGTDTVINLDIGELWAYDLGEYGFGAVPESLFSNKDRVSAKDNDKLNPSLRLGRVKHENYLNADVLLIRPKFFMENFERILEACKFVYEKKYKFLDQDVLNYLFSESYLKLPRRFNALVYMLRRRNEFTIGKEIYHFAVIKPYLDTDDVYNKLFFEYFLKTPFANADMFRNLDKDFSRQYERLKVAFLHYTNLLAHRERVFLMDENEIEKMRKIFAIEDDELIVDSTDATATKEFFETSDELKGKNFIYIRSKDYRSIELELRKRNFVRGEDFIDASNFLSIKDGGNWLIYNSRITASQI